jgi:D-tyrosyl-tRNA(Tyr) deacylase
MRAICQRVSRATVAAKDKVVGSIGPGLLVLLAAGKGDDAEQVRWMAEKILGLRIFPDTEGKMNLSVTDVAGEILVVSQFTLYGDCRKGKRPSYSEAAPPHEAEALYRSFIETLRARGISVQAGVFGAMMQVELINDGPVTLILDSP